MTVFMTVVMKVFMIAFMTAFMTHDYLKPFFDIVLLEYGGPHLGVKGRHRRLMEVWVPHVLSLAVHLFFCVEQVEGVILSHSYSLSFHVRGLLHVKS